MSKCSRLITAALGSSRPYSQHQRSAACSWDSTPPATCFPFAVWAELQRDAAKCTDDQTIVRDNFHCVMATTNAHYERALLVATTTHSLSLSLSAVPLQCACNVILKQWNSLATMLSCSPAAPLTAVARTLVALPWPLCVCGSSRHAVHTAHSVLLLTV